MKTMELSSVPTNLGTVYVLKDKSTVKRLSFRKKDIVDYVDKYGVVVKNIKNDKSNVAKELRAYFDGKAKRFRTRVDYSEGTKFQKRVWDYLMKIPYGKLVTYGEIAKKIGKPKAARAVGNAVGANPVPVIVPCHRVVATDGLGGYSCGVRIKKNLLKLEGAQH